MPKIYVLDIGIRNYFTRSFNANHELDGHLIENFVYLELLHQFKKDRIHFYRTIGKAEIDFAIESTDDSIILGEVKYRPKTKMPVAMRNFIERYPNTVSNKILFTKDILQKNPDGTFFIPVNLLPFVEINS